MSEQMTLIDPIDVSRGAARRAALDAARKRADRAIENVAAKTDDMEPNWCLTACEKLRVFARAQGGVFTIELSRLALRHQISEPSDGRAWGRVARMALSREYIERVPNQFFPAASSNGSPKPVYRKGPKA